MLWLLSFLFIPSCFGINKVESNSKPIDHVIWDELLKKHINDDGLVNYKGFMQDSLQLKSYLKLLSKNHPNDANWSNDEQLAYWLNAYNAFTIKLILDYYPVKSIKDIAGAIPFINSSWDLKFIQIENETYDLNNIEHGIIRNQFNEPRIHFALVCAAVSCPPLRNEAYQAEKLEKQLQNQAYRFINDSSKNKITPEQAQLSKIFSWYKGDFTHQKSLLEYLNLHSEIKLTKDTEINYLDYDWQLNEI